MIAALRSRLEGRATPGGGTQLLAGSSACRKSMDRPADGPTAGIVPVFCRMEDEGRPPSWSPCRLTRADVRALACLFYLALTAANPVSGAGCWAIAGCSCPLEAMVVRIPPSPGRPLLSRVMPCRS